MHFCTPKNAPKLCAIFLTASAIFCQSPVNCTELTNFRQTWLPKKYFLHFENCNVKPRWASKWNGTIQHVYTTLLGHFELNFLEIFSALEDLERREYCWSRDQSRYHWHCKFSIGQLPLYTLRYILITTRSLIVFKKLYRLIEQARKFVCLFGCFESLSGYKDRPLGRFSPSPSVVWRSVFVTGRLTNSPTLHLQYIPAPFTESFDRLKLKGTSILFAFLT